MSNLTAINFVEEFCQALDEGGDIYFSTGDEPRDMHLITERIKFQGYWAGDKLRYFFDMALLEKGCIKLLRTEERRFGQ